MDLGKVEQRRSWLLQLLVILIMTFLALITVFLWAGAQSSLVKALLILSLLTCLYVLTEERRLRRMHDQLVREVAIKTDQVAALGEELVAEKAQFTSLEHRLRELTALYRAISAVNAVADPAQTFDAVLLAAVDLVGGNCGSLMLVDRKQGILTFASAFGLPDEVVNQPSLKIGDGIAGWVAQNAEPVLLTGPAGADGRFKNISPREPELNMAISLPLQLGENVIGVLNIGSSGGRDTWAFTDDDHRFAYIFAQHAAIAIERAQLLEEHAQLRIIAAT